MQHSTSTPFRSLTRLAIAGALLAACGDDDPSDTGIGGGGGSSGTSGAAGTSGGSGAPGSSGSAGSAGASGSAGAAGNAGAGGMAGDEPPPCRDCVELRVPVDDSDQTALFTFEAGPFDMSVATLRFRMRPLAYGAQLVASPFARDEDLQGVLNIDTRLSEDRFPEDTWATVEIDLTSYPTVALIPAADAGPNVGDGGVDPGSLVPDPTSFDKSRVTRFGLQIGTTPDYAGRPTTVVVVVDTVSFAGIAGNPLAEKTFDENTEGLTIDPSSTPGAEIIHHPAD